MTKRVDETIEEYRERDAKRAREWREIRRTEGPRGTSVTSALVDRPEPVKIHGGVVKRTSTLTGADGRVSQWVIEEKAHRDQLLAMKAAAKALADELPRLPPIPAPAVADDDLLVGYKISDLHMGMLSWKPETGDNYDVKIGERLLTGAFEYLINAAPPAGQALIGSVGDFFHYDSTKTVTPASGHQLDADTRYQDMIFAGVRLYRRVIDMVLRKHATVRVIPKPGNHDPYSTPWLALLLASAYENDPRVTIDLSPHPCGYHMFGSTLIGITHGDKGKIDGLPLLMATDQPAAWGATEFRYWWTGHRHTKQTMDFPGCSVEILPVLIPGDSWSVNMGFRSIRQMDATVYHHRYGRLHSHFVPPKLIEEMR